MGCYFLLVHCSLVFKRNVNVLILANYCCKLTVIDIKSWYPHIPTVLILWYQELNSLSISRDNKKLKLLGRLAMFTCNLTCAFTLTIKSSIPLKKLFRSYNVRTSFERYFTADNIFIIIQTVWIVRLFCLGVTVHINNATTDFITNP